MLVTNLEEISSWLRELQSSGYELLRFKNYPVDQLEMPWEYELDKHAENYLINQQDFTFHHIRLLFKKLKTEEIKQPLVAVVNNKEINVNPGGSRLMVCKKLGISFVPLDIILQKKEKHLIDFSAEYEKIEEIDQFLKPFEEINSKIFFQFKDKSGGYGVKFWYQVNCEKQWHWCNDDTKEWILKNKSKVCNKLIDYYFL